MGVHIAPTNSDENNPRTANQIARQLGIDKVYSQVLPQDKLRILRELQAGGKKVAFAGNGANDAPALAAADVGIAMGLAGSGVALETAVIGLMTDEIQRIPQVIAISHQALRAIRQNAILSMSWNVLSVFLGIFEMIGPVIGAIIHEFSALPALANSARIIQYQPEKWMINMDDADGKQPDENNEIAHTNHSHPQRESGLKRLARSEGHVRAVKRMVEEDTPCPDVLVQIAAIRSALNGAGRLMLEDHMQGCMVKAAQDGKFEDALRDLKKSLDQFIG
ncbi:MAG TPA: metal-sensing transcriptional repressor [Levilinea sp.]|nr:metal-sensing transcriptional repressor [Levilinea sp.]